MSSRPIVAVLSLLCLAVVSPHARAQVDSVGYVTLRFNASLVPGVSVGDAVANATGKRIVNNVALSVLAGRAHRLDGVEWAGLASIYAEDVRGAQFSGLANLVGGDALGAQFAGLLNVVSGDARVAQFAGAVNIAGGRATGAQYAGGVNLAAGRLRGAQFAGGVNVVAGDLIGAQFAGGVNVALGTMDGVQVAPVNAGMDVSGVQIGVVNVAQRHTGVPIGVVSYVRDVGLGYDAWIDEVGLISASLRTGNRHFANYLGIGVAPFGSNTYLGPLVGLGIELPMYEDVVSFSFDVLSHGLYNADLENNWMQISRVRATFGVSVLPGLQLFAGPSFNVLLADAEDAGIDLAPWSVYDYASDDVFVQLWPGFVVGFRIR